MDAQAAAERIDTLELDADVPVIAYCGGGVAATGTALGFVLAGRPQPKVYDGSWTEWSAIRPTPKVDH
jgi:thiosulfate/3-mercaptopyruvate sulfurtransferase